MTTVTALSTKARIAAAAAAVAAATTLTPAGVANAAPVVPVPQAIGTLAADDPVSTCDASYHGAEECYDVLGINFYFTVPSLFVIDSGDPLSPPMVWIGTPNPDFEPSAFGITFPNPTGLNYQACFFGAGVTASAYTGTTFVGVGYGC